MPRSHRPRAGSLLLLAPVFGLLAACSSAADGGGDQSAALSADHRNKDAGAKDSGPVKTDASVCNPKGAWTSQFAPPSVAGIDWSKTISIDDFIAADCDAATDNRDAHRKGDVLFEWNDGQMFVEYDPKTRAVNRIESYMPFTMAFHSREGGAYGDHTYVIGQGVLSRDGKLMPIFTSSHTDAALSELLDGYTATFFPDMAPAAADCVAAKTCSSSSGSDSSTIDFNLPAPADLHLLIDAEGESATNGTPLAFAIFPNPAVTYGVD